MAARLTCVVAAALALAFLSVPPADAATFTPRGTLYVGHLLLDDCLDDCPAYPTGARETWRISTMGGVARGRVLSSQERPAPMLNSSLSPAGDALVYADQRRAVRIAPVDLRRMTQSPGVEVAGLEPQTGGLVAAWSPDGLRLALAGELQGRPGIWIVNRDGSGLRRLACACKPAPVSLAWSTLDQLAFTAEMPDGDEQTELWVVGADGSGLRRVTAPNGDASDEAAAWAPDGRRLAFERANDVSTRVMVLDVATGALHAIAADGSTPAWSPDGTQLAYFGADGFDPSKLGSATTGVTIATDAGRTLGHIRLSEWLLGSGYLDELAWHSTDDAAAEPPPPALSIYISTPAGSPTGRDELAGARLALADAGGAVDGRPVQLRAFRAPPPGSSWVRDNRTPTLVTLDPAAIGYIGEDDSESTARSLPTLAAAGIPEVTPAAGASLLTHVLAQNSDWPPYQASGLRTLVRMLPDDDIAAAGAATLAARRRAHRVWLVDDGNYEFAASRGAVRHRLAALHVRVIGASTYERASQAPRAARALRRSRADALIFTGATSPAVAALWNAVHRAVPRARLYAARVDTLFTASDEPGFIRRLSRGTRARTMVVSPRVPVAALGAGASALAGRIRGAYGAEPTVHALAGYESMALLLDAIHRAGPASGRDAVRDALFATRDRASILGRYSMTATGDTTLSREAIYRIRPNGALVYAGSLDALG